MSTLQHEWEILTSNGLLIEDVRHCFSSFNQLCYSYTKREGNLVAYNLAKYAIGIRGVNVRPNPRTRHEPDTGFFGLGLGLNGFGS